METATITHVLHYERAFFEFERVILKIGDGKERRVYQIQEMTENSAVILHTDETGEQTRENIGFGPKKLFKDGPDVLANLTEKRKDLSHQMLNDGWDMVSNDFKNESPGINGIILYTWTMKFQRG